MKRGDSKVTRDPNAGGILIDESLLLVLGQSLEGRPRLIHGEGQRLSAPPASCPGIRLDLLDIGNPFGGEACDAGDRGAVFSKGIAAFWAIEIITELLFVRKGDAGPGELGRADDARHRT